MILSIKPSYCFFISSSCAPKIERLPKLVPFPLVVNIVYVIIITGIDKKNNIIIRR
nr:MAG TPA: hypothetical protein [Caudoviricetes sp.]